MSSIRPDFATRCEQAGAAGDDLVRAWRSGHELVIVIADDAGGTGLGREAATQVASAVEAALGRGHRAPTPDACLTLLYETDYTLLAQRRGAETTAVIAVISGTKLWGASVGDSGAWLIDDDTWTDLTESQVHKPLLGSGVAAPVPFDARLTGTLLVATDGLLKYASPSNIATLVRGAALQDAASALVEEVRLRSGSLQDDVALALIRGASR